MNPFRTFVTVILLLIAVPAAPQSDAGEWIGSYRNAYSEMIRFEKYGKAKSFIQYQLQLVPRGPAASLSGARLSLVGNSFSIDLPLDFAGRITLPLSKTAYDENATLVNRGQVLQLTARPRVSLTPRADGVYDVQDLIRACDQALGFLRYRDERSYRDKKCAGVRFSYAHGVADPLVQFRRREFTGKALTVSQGPAYPDDDGAQYRIVTYHFSDRAEKGQVVTHAAPAVIAPIFE